MQALPARLKQLEDRLAALPPDADAMLLSELDGYLAGILVCPDLIMPGEWLPPIWGGGDEEGAASAFGSLDEVQELLGLIMEHYNALSREFHRDGGSYAPIYDVDPRSGEVVWTFWMAGFWQAMALRPEVWAAILESDDEDGVLALTGLVALIGVDEGDSDLPEEKVEELSRDAPDLIPHLVLELNAWRLRRAATTPPAPAGAAHRKVGRNDPCPCGSGRKFKRCCGAH